MLGNEAVARGAYEAGAAVASAYPGTPSTEITENLAKYGEIFTEWAPNEKVALEVSLGASIGGARAICAMKHVGLNVAADPLFTASYTGVGGGLVICVADDQGMHSSQNEQDSRQYARASKILMLEPSDSAECKQFVKRAFALSEQFDTPALLRLCTRVSHSRGLVEMEEREKPAPKEYVKNPGKYVMMPAMARARRVAVEERTRALREFAETTELNVVEYYDRSIGIISAGIAYEYVKEALGEKASYLKLGVIYPLPARKIKEFFESVRVCYVMEELDPFIEEHCRALGLAVIGKDQFSAIGEYTAAQIRETVLGQPPDQTPAASEPLPARPPVMCAGCPHRGVFYALKQFPGLTVMGDIGCYTLAALPPLQMMDACVCMGASIGMAHGMEKAAESSGQLSGRERAAKTVAVLGDSTFIHSGITGLIDVVYNKGTSTVIILDNSITGMTGHQENPATGYTIKGEPTRQVDLQKLCEAAGVDRVTTVDPFDLDTLRKTIKEELAAAEPSVIIAKRPCALLKKVKREGPYRIDADKCLRCGSCLRIGCPAITKANALTTATAGALPAIDLTQCAGCGYCARVCKAGAIAGAMAPAVTRTGGGDPA
jgi:indolepyruvate ferredoxin oxidoreductase alpha subunit